MAEKPVIIIRKKKGGGHGGHHGGAWKVAYADFVTAMMSFFLLLWLLNVTTDIQRRGIADYFAPASISKSESGAGGVFGGQTITSDGAQISQYTPPTVDEVTMATVGRGEEGDSDTRGKSDHGGGDDASKNDGLASGKGQDKAQKLNKDDQALADAMKHEEEAFKEAESLLKQALTANPNMAKFADQIFIDRTPEGLRIQIVDKDKFSMFPSGSTIPYEAARDLLRMVGRVVAKLPNRLSVTGHTDSTPFQTGSRRDNWSLSTERANVSREELVTAGVEEQRIQRVVGLADREPFAADPKDPRNRRISIVLLRQSIPPADTGTTAATAVDGSAAPASAPAPAPTEAAPAPAAPAPAPVSIPVTTP